MADYPILTAIVVAPILGAMLVLAKKHALATPITEIAYTHMQACAARRKRESTAT